MSDVQVVIVTPEKTALDMMADFLVLPLVDGEIGVLTGHSPMVGRLGFGEMRVRVGNQTDKYYVDGGFTQIADNVVSVLTGRVLAFDELDAGEIRERLRLAENQRPETPAEIALRVRAIAQAKAQLRMVEKA